MILPYHPLLQWADMLSTNKATLSDIKSSDVYYHERQYTSQKQILNNYIFFVFLMNNIIINIINNKCI